MISRNSTHQDGKLYVSTRSNPYVESLVFNIHMLSLVKHQICFLAPPDVKKVI